MIETMQPMLQHLFQVSSLDDLSRQRLESFVEEHPSFGIGHYLLSRKLQAESSGQFAAETQRTSLYFTNPFWLQWQLDNIVLAGGHAEGTPAPAQEPAVAAAEPSVAAAEPSEPPFFAEEPVQLATDPAPSAADPDPSATEPSGDDLAGVLSATPPSEPTPVAATEEDGEPSAADRLLRSIEEAKGLRETLHKINHGFEAKTGEPVAEVEQPIKDVEPPFVLDETESAEPVAANPVAAEPVAEHPIAQPVAEPATAHPVSQPVAEPTFTFEPYHTIDYFASQGIRFTQDENPSDPLGKQLKSFTDWLRGMRRLPRQDREVVPDRVAEEAVQTIAAHSIEGKDVLTETMAEVLAMQGMRERARAVYEKLSLLNPDKRAYFAAKIEQLNIP